MDDEQLREAHEAYRARLRALAPASALMAEPIGSGQSGRGSGPQDQGPAQWCVLLGQVAGYRVPTFARSGEILEAEDGRLKLAAYLERLASANQRRFAYLVANQPDLAELLRDEEEEE